MKRKFEILSKKLDNLKGTKQTQTKQNTYNRNIQDSKVINLTKIKLNNKETKILAVGYKYNYSDINTQTIKQSITIETEITINKFKMNNNKQFKYEAAKLISEMIKKYKNYNLGETKIERPTNTKKKTTYYT